MKTKLQFSNYALRRLVRSVAIGLVVAMCGLALAVTPVGMILERKFGLDWLFSMRGNKTPPPEVFVVGVDKDTGKNLGQLFDLQLGEHPKSWPRTVHARLIERLIEENAQVIVFDFDFTRAKLEDDDKKFADAIAKADRVVLWECLVSPKLAPSITFPTCNAPESALTKAGGDGDLTKPKVLPPTHALAGAPKALGPFAFKKWNPAALEFSAFQSDADGAPPTAPAIALQLKALTVYDEWLSVLKEACGARSAHPRACAPGVEDLPAHAGELTKPADLEQLMQKLRRIFQQDALLRQRVGPVLDWFIDFKVGLERAAAYIERLPTTANSAALADHATPTHQLLTALTALYAGPDQYYVNFYGQPWTIPTIQYQTLMRGEAAARIGDLTNHVVFVGYSGPAELQQLDRYDTIFTGKDGVELTGVEIFATAYANLLSQRAVRPSDTITTTFSVLSFGFLAGILAYLLPATAALPSALAWGILYYLFVQRRFNETGLWLPLLTPLVQLALALLIGLLGQYLLERRKEKQIIQAIRYYLPESLVRDLSERQVDPTTVNRVVFGTCLATDMSGFTALAESKSPRQLAQFMNEYFDAVAQGIKRHGVDVMEFRADMIMCAWIATVRSPTISRRGVDAAIEVSEIIGRFAGERGSLKFEPRVGLQEGSVYVGHTGGGGHLVYSVQGDAANTAARLESLNKHLGTHVLAAESVVQNSDGLLLRPLGLFQLSGKTDPTPVVEILGRKDSAKAEQLDLCSQFAEGLAVFQRKEWLLAAGVFQAINKRFVDGPSRFYSACSQRYSAETRMFEGPTVIQMHDK